MPECKAAKKYYSKCGYGYFSIFLKIKFFHFLTFCLQGYGLTEIVIDYFYSVKQHCIFACVRLFSAVIRLFF